MALASLLSQKQYLFVSREEGRNKNKCCYKSTEKRDHLSKGTVSTELSGSNKETGKLPPKHTWPSLCLTLAISVIC